MAFYYTSFKPIKFCKKKNEEENRDETEKILHRQFYIFFCSERIHSTLSIMCYFLMPFHVKWKLMKMAILHSFRQSFSEAIAILSTFQIEYVVICYNVRILMFNFIAEWFASPGNLL